jgi:hypothetical protein
VKTSYFSVYNLNEKLSTAFNLAIRSAQVITILLSAQLKHQQFPAVLIEARASNSGFRADAFH